MTSVRTITPEAEPTDSAAPAPPAAPYHYFVSWTHSMGAGNCEMTLSRPITGMSDVREIERWLTGQGVNQPTLNNWILLSVDAPAAAPGGER